MAKSTTESEWIAASDTITCSEEVHQIDNFLHGKSEVLSDSTQLGPVYCDNRGAVISARKQELGDIAKRTRHVALRYAAVKEQAKRLVFVPTTAQRADALTKPPTAEMCDNVFHVVNMKPLLKGGEEDLPMAKDCTSYAVPWTEDINYGSVMCSFIADTSAY
jgi:hypothetical protein